MATRKQTEGGGKPGPEPDRVKIEGDWEEAVKRALGKKRPPEGWPSPPGKKKRAKKGAK
jgi:hypothetical protein